MLDRKDLLNLHRIPRALCLFFCLLATAPCTAADEVNLYAAASLTDVLTELASIYQKSHPKLAIKKSFAGSSTLAKQIAQGAPADIFISADTAWVDLLDQQQLIQPKSRQQLAGNALVFIAPVANRNLAISFVPKTDLSAVFSGRLCTADTASVPAGKYAKEALTYYGWWSSITNRLVTTEDVRGALVFVERGECNLGIVYKTDAQLSSKVAIVGTFPSESHAQIVYAGALTQRATQEATRFWHFLQTNDAKAVFARYGFTSPSNTP